MEPLTIPPDVLARARAEADRAGIGLPEWLRRAAQVAEGLAAVDDVWAEIGPPDSAEQEQADAALGRSAQRLAARHAADHHAA